MEERSHEGTVQPITTAATKRFTTTGHRDAVPEKLGTVLPELEHTAVERNHTIITNNCAVCTRLFPETPVCQLINHAVSDKSMTTVHNFAVEVQSAKKHLEIHAATTKNITTILTTAVTVRSSKR